MKKSVRAMVHASELLTGVGVRRKDGRHPKEEDLGRIPDGAVVYEEGAPGSGKVLWTGPTDRIPKEYRRARAQDLRGKRAVVPGFVDAHTHLIFDGDRSAEFADRCGGATYEEIAARGGGIASTVRATRAASATRLESLAVKRLKEIAAFGVRTIEIKSGYGLSLESELRILEVIPRLRARFPELTLTATFLGAHDFPKDRPRGEYLKELIDIQIAAAARHGLKTKVHADELANTESAAMAAEVGALSADHLLCVSEKGIQSLAHSKKTVAMILPGTAFYLKAPHAPARRLIDAGACVGIATDFNPGSSMCTSLPAILTIAALYLGLTRAELFAAVTYNGAKALGLEASKGTIEPGRDADLAVLPFERFEEIYYRFAWSP
jgi:imidazolonepropionase